MYVMQRTNITMRNNDLHPVDSRSPECLSYLYLEEISAAVKASGLWPELLAGATGVIYPDPAVAQMMWRRSLLRRMY
jgi:hypothetical protein